MNQEKSPMDFGVDSQTNLIFLELVEKAGQSLTPPLFCCLQLLLLSLATPNRASDVASPWSFWKLPEASVDVQKVDLNYIPFISFYTGCNLKRIHGIIFIRYYRSVIHLKSRSTQLKHARSLFHKQVRCHTCGS